MAMVSMKMEPEVEEMPGQAEMGEPSYPEGLCIKLEADQLKALGLTVAPRIGTEMTITAKVYVKSASETKTFEGVDPMAELQITDMEIQSGQARTDGIATMLYGGMA